MAFCFFTLGSVLTLFPSLLSFCSLSSLTRWLRDFCHFRIVFWEIIRVRVKTGRWEYQTERLGSRGPLLVSHFALHCCCCAALVYRKSFLASLHFFFWCVVHCPVSLLACKEPDVECGMFSGK